MYPSVSQSESIPPTPSTDTHDAESETESIRIAEKISKRRLALNRMIAGLALATTLLAPVNAYFSDTRANKDKAALSVPELDPINREGEIEHSSSIFYLAGFDTIDGSEFGKKVGLALHQITDGEDVSVNYGDAPLDPEEIAKKIITYTEQNSLRSISLAGNSLGGIVTLNVAKYIIEHSYIQVEAIYLNATPDGSAGLLPQTKNNLTTMMSWLEKVPESKYSTYARYVATMAQSTERIANSKNSFGPIGSFIDVSNETIELIQEKRRPGMWLIVDQALAITNADLEDIIADIGELRGEKRMPYIISMRTENQNDDTVVDVEKSSSNTCLYADEAKIQCRIVLVPGQHHTSYDFNTESYFAALENQTEIIEGIDHERIAYMLAQRSMYFTDTYVAWQ